MVVTLIRSCGDCHYCSRSIETQCEKTFSLDEHSPLSDHAGATIGQGLNAGAFAEYVVVEQSQVCRIPRELPLDVASMLGCGVLTGFRRGYQYGRPQAREHCRCHRLWWRWHQ